MYNLVFDTTASACKVCLQKDGKIAEAFEKEMEFGQAEELLPAIKRILDKQKILMKDLSAICVCTGPGSFTGVRSCVSAARAFAIALPECKIMGISAFEAYMSGFSDEELADVNAVLIETKREDFYCQLFGKNREKISEPMAANYEDIIALLKGKKVSMTGDGVERFLSKPSGLSLHSIKLMRGVSIEDLAECSYKKYQHKVYDFPKPTYIKAPDLGPKA